jgi:HK97 family phage portal protein
MGWKDYILPPAFNKKATEWHRAVVKMLGLTPQWSERNYENFAKEGYNANVWVYRCIQAVAQGAAGVPWILYQEDSKGERKEILVHDLLKLLRKPNEFMSRQELIEAYVAYALICGNSYLDMNGPRKGAPPKELWALRPDRMKVVPHPTNFINGYTYTIGDQKTTMDKDRVSHLKLFNPIGDYYGLAPIEVAARGIDNDNAANGWNNSLLTNGARPGGALVTEETLTTAQFENLKEELDKNYRGAKNAGKPMVLEGGLKWQEMSLNPRDMEFIASKKMSILEICAAFGVPPEVVGYGETKTYSNYQEARKALYEDAVLPMLDRIRDKLNADLVPKFGDNLYLDYNKDAIEALQENRDAVYKRAVEAYKGEVITKNEARAEIGYDDDAEGGDEYYKPPVKEVAAGSENDEGKKGLFFNVKALNIETDEQKDLFWKAMENGREKFYGRVAKEVQKQFEKERKAVLNAFKNGGESGALKAIDQKSWQKLYAAIYVEVMQTFGTSLMNQFKKNAGNHMETKAPLIPLEMIFNVFDKAVQKFIASTVAKKVVGVTDVTKTKIRKIIKTQEAAGASIDQIAEELDKLYLDQIIPNRSEVIARTEVIGASNAGNAYAADQTGLKLSKTWLATRDGRERESHANIDGEKQNKEDLYTNGLLFPGDPNGDAEEVIQCRCTETYAVIK